MRLNFRQIEAFRAVFQTNGMTAAANLIGVTQQAVSRLIRDLEAELGLTLFDRQGRKLLATPEAAALFREVQRSFHGLDRIERAAVEIKRKRAGVLRVAGSGAMSLYLLPAVVQQFRDQWPGVLVSLNMLPSSEVLETIGRQIDEVGVADVASTGPGVDIEPLPPLEFVNSVRSGGTAGRLRAFGPCPLPSRP